MRNRKLYIPESCRKCGRESKCTYPCEDAYNEFKMQNPQNQENSLCNEKYNQPVARVSEDNTYDKTTLSYGCKDEIEDILEWSVDQPEFLQIINGLRKPSDIISWKDLLYIMTEKNIKYCSDNGLCEICHSELKLVQDRGEVWGARNVVVGEYSSCPNGCN